MKQILLFASLFFFGIEAWSQDSSAQPVKWTFSAASKGENRYQLILKAAIQPGWRLFSVTMPEDLPHTRLMLDSSSTGFARIESILENRPPVSVQDTLLGTGVRYFEKDVEIGAELILDKKEEVTGEISYMAYRGDEFTDPVVVPFRFGFDAAGQLVSQKGGLEESAEATNLIKRTAIDLDHPVNDCGGTGVEGNQSIGLWRIFALGFLGGLLGLIMPCTFPMIPLTVSFFTKKSGERSRALFNAGLYGFFIFLIYVLLSIPFYFLDAGNSDILNNISTNAWLNLFFAAVFFVFALSFFGLFEITLPGSFTNKINARSDIGSLGGIFFMALTLAIVSFSCTGPILGSLLVGALNQDGGAFQLTVAMAGFGLALGLPFALFAFFPNWLHSLPRSGSWMNTVKIVFAFIELALMIKFLSNADLVMHWGILKREVFFGIWILIGLAITLYLFGWLRFSHDAPPARLSTGRWLLAFLFLAFTLYLVPGITNTRYANRSLISGFPPPLSYSLYAHDSTHRKGVEANVINDYQQALEMARAQHKPLLIDFTGWACVNCRKMEENVWVQPEVKELIDKNYILVSLYVDDRKQLPGPERFLYTGSDGSQKPIRTVGDKFATFQSENFRNASQPLYAILDPSEKLLNRPVGYTPSAKTYADWLRCGLDAFRKINP